MIFVKMQQQSLPEVNINIIMFYNSLNLCGFKFCIRINSFVNLKSVLRVFRFQITLRGFQLDIYREREKVYKYKVHNLSIF